MTDATRDDYDAPWKEAISRYFAPFLEFFFPAIHAQIDWSQGYQLLDKEFQQVVREGELGRRHADMLLRVVACLPLPHLRPASRGGGPQYREPGHPRGHRPGLAAPPVPSDPENPFSWLCAAHLQAQRHSNDSTERLGAKSRLFRGLFGRGMDSEDVRELCRLVDWIMALTPDLDRVFKDQLDLT